MYGGIKKYPRWQVIESFDEVIADLTKRESNTLIFHSLRRILSQLRSAHQEGLITNGEYNRLRNLVTPYINKYEDKSLIAQVKRLEAELKHWRNLS